MPRYGLRFARGGWVGSIMNFLPKLASNLDPLDLSFLSSWDYKHELPMTPSYNQYFMTLPY
jgi:hypothetical protein